MWGERSRIGEGKVKSKREKKAWEIEKKNTNRQTWLMTRKEEWKVKENRCWDQIFVSSHATLPAHTECCGGSGSPEYGQNFSWRPSPVWQTHRNQKRQRKPFSQQKATVLVSDWFPIVTNKSTDNTKLTWPVTQHKHSLTRSLACRFRFLVKIIIKNTLHTVFRCLHSYWQQMTS